MSSRSDGKAIICNLCKENLRVKYGCKPSTVPLFSATTNKDICSLVGSETVILANIIRKIGISLDVGTGGSVCKRCARKIANCFKSEIRDEFIARKSQETPNSKLTKRPTSVRTPKGITPTSKRSKPPTCDHREARLSSKKELFGKSIINTTSITNTDSRNEYEAIDDHISSLMNLPVEIFSTQPPLVKVFVGYPGSSRVSDRSCEDKQESAFVKNICKENYRAAANAALKFPPFRREVVKELIELLRKEMRNYSEGPTPYGKYTGEPLDLSEYSSESLLEEAEVKLPLLTEIIKGCAKSARSFLANKHALTLSSFLNTWMPRSKFIYRLNAILIHGGCKTEAMDLVHRLGLSCHPNTIRNQVQACANHFDKEIVQWKKKIEKNRKAILFLEEVIKRQTGGQRRGGPPPCPVCLVDDGGVVIELDEGFYESYG
ncbi:hypothetical protein AC249_AIPGENE17609 [Exaiptasia diaphana]|nr:hypothetical protein AC249_AIPGENE17609 [Exaiptasia diaphana]